MYLNQEVIKPARLEIPILFVSAWCFFFFFFLNGLNVICCRSRTRLLTSGLQNGDTVHRLLMSVNSHPEAVGGNAAAVMLLSLLQPTRLDAYDGMLIYFIFSIFIVVF